VFLAASASRALRSELPKQPQPTGARSWGQLARGLDKPLEVIPARLTAIRADLAQLHHVPTRLTRKTLQNHKSNVKSALLWLAREKRIPKHGAALSPAWEALRIQVKDRFSLWRLSAFMRFCSANDITPAEVDEIVLERFLRYRAQCGAVTGDASGRRLARTWNSNVGHIRGWPARRLTEPAVKALT